MTQLDIAVELMRIRSWVEHWKTDKEFGLLPTDSSLDMVLVRLDALLKEFKEKIDG